METQDLFNFISDLEKDEEFRVTIKTKYFSKTITRPTSEIKSSSKSIVYNKDGDVFQMAISRGKFSFVFKNSQYLTIGRQSNNIVLVECHNLQARDEIEIELGISYDQFAVQKMGTVADIESEINALRVDLANAFIDDKMGNILMYVAKPIYMPVSPNIFAGTSSVGLSSLGSNWGARICKKVDLAMHITGIDAFGQGHSNGGQTYCNREHGIDYDIAGVRTTSGGVERDAFFHELGHLMGFNHEHSVLCSGEDKGYFMCPTGTGEDLWGPNQSFNWKISDSLVMDAQWAAVNAECVNSEGGPADCSYCSFLNSFTFNDEVKTVGLGSLNDPMSNGGNIQKVIKQTCGESEEHEILMRSQGLFCGAENYEVELTFNKTTADFLIVDYPSFMELTETQNTFVLSGFPDTEEEQSIKFIVNNITGSSSSNIPTTSVSIRHKSGGANAFGTISILLQEKQVVVSDNGTGSRFWNDIAITNSNSGLDFLSNSDWTFYVKTDLVFREKFNDRTLDFSGCRFIMDPGTKIIIEGGNIVNFMNSTARQCVFETCEGVWKGIDLKSDAILSMKDCEITDCSTAIRARQGSDIDIQGCSLVGVDANSSAGIRIGGKSELKHTFISNFSTGVSVNNETQGCEMEFVTIKNAIFGIHGQSSFIDMLGCSISESLHGVYLQGCPGSMITYCEINSTSHGIIANNSPATFVYQCKISDRNDTSHPNVGISMVGSSDATVFLSDVNAMEKGIYTAFMDAQVYGNQNISVSGENTSVAGGIQMIGAGDLSFIAYNPIIAPSAAYGVETHMCTGTTVYNNWVRYGSAGADRSAAVRTFGSFDMDIIENDIIGNGSGAGLLVQNSGDGYYSCNDFALTDEGLAILYNAQYHDILGNGFLDCATDLDVRSITGIQRNTGNTFINGNCSAVELTIDELFDSIFEVFPGGNFRPANPMPGGEDWFVNVLQEPDVDCADDGTPGIQSPPNPAEIACAYFYSLKNMKKANPIRYLVRLYHLLAKYERNSNLQLPDCIATDSTVTNICGIKELIAVQQTLDSIAALTTDIREVNSLKESILYGDSTSRDSIVTLLSTELHSRARFMRAENKSDSLSLEKLAQATERIVCNDSLVTTWKEVQKIYISYLLSDSINLAEQQKLDALSRLCSDKYGESVNLARALASTYSKINYDDLDNCEGNGKALPREITNRDYNYNVVVYPNPTKSDITISFDRDIDASILLKDISGKLLSTTKMQGDRSKTISLLVSDGVYFLHTVANSGRVLSVNKVVVAK